MTGCETRRAGAPRALCWVPRQLPVAIDAGIRYLLDASFGSLPIYFALKGKHDYVLANADAFLAEVRQQVELVAADYDVVAYPESRFPFLRTVVAGLSNAVELRKRFKDEIFELAGAGHKWSKLERLSQAQARAKMGESFTINLIKANQRQRYAPFLFQPVSLAPGARVLLLDDFIMTGMTLRAMEACMGREGCDAFGVFCQRPALPA